MKSLKSPFNIVLCVLTALLCVALLASIVLWAVYADRPSDGAALAARDVCNMVLPLIGICVMLIVISVRSKRIGRGEEK